MIHLFAPLFLGVTVTLPVEARVRGAELRLGALAQVEGEVEAEVELVRALSLGWAPAPGYSRLLRADALEAELAGRAAGIEVRLEGAALCRVWPETEALAGAAVQAAAEAELRRHYAGREATLRPLEPIGDLVVPAGERAAELRSLVPDGTARPGPVSVPVRVLVDGAPYRTVWTRWEVVEFEERAVLARAVRAGETISADLLVRRRVPVGAPRPGAPGLDEAMLEGARAARDLAPQTVLTEIDVVRPALVERGDVVVLEVQKGAVRARVPAVASQGGARGDRIRVATLEGGREMVGVIAARDLVRIQLSSAR